ncbi:hypothetical protein SDC9_31906 [bioreactor metagenome]|uniref:Uncharacterized protein n=1 Tax=bioreactor metagenome TaxID=1076179 RepID=A0A644V422_9ZZZZ|nr:hypothetical protein [Lentimicrobium sp.]MEA5110256.1 hypothetical protein [Lentimicrobium sp.]
MTEKILTGKFREAFLNMDLDAMSSLLDDHMTFFSKATLNRFTNKQDFLDHANEVFDKLKNMQALTIPGERLNKTSFELTYQFETWVPVPHYLITNEGFGLVSCLECRTIDLKTLVRLKFNEQLISGIKIIQTKNIECRKTAFSG